MLEKIHLYYTNDLHSHFENWPKVVHFLSESKARIKARNESCFLFDVGDHVDRVSQIAEAFMGKKNVELLEDANYDVVTIGNNEGITLAHDDLYHLYDHAKFSVVCSNLHNQKCGNPKWLKNYKILKTKGQTSIAVIGLTAPFNAYYNLLGWQVDFPLETLHRQINIIKEKEKADIIILLSHLGLNEDREIARNFPEIDVIIGGHTHHLLRTGEEINETILTAAGRNCEFVGNVILTWDHREGKLETKEAYTINVTHMESDYKTVNKLNYLERQAEIILNERVAFSKDDLIVDWDYSTPIIEELTKTLHEWTKADCAMLNAGLLLDTVHAGEITLGTIHHICPHPINPCVVSLTGHELIEVIRSTLTDTFKNLALKGFGFRGVKLGKMVYAGLDIELTTSLGEAHLKSVKFNGNHLDKNKTYTVATADMFTFGRLLPEIARSELKQYYLPEFIRDLLAETLRKKFNDE